MESKALLSFLKRRQKSLLLTETKALDPERRRRNRQLNIKVHEDCRRVFGALAKAQGLSKSALLEDLVAERLERLTGQGLKFEG